MFHCYTGHPMYQAAGPEGAIVRRMLEGDNEVLAPSKDGDLDPHLVGLINRIISVDAADRPADAAAVLQQLEALPR